MQSAHPSESPPSPHNEMTIDPPSPKQQASKHQHQQQHPPIRSDPKLGNNNLIAFIRNRDIWVVTPDGYEVQLTPCSFQTEDPTLSCGTVEYVMQVIDKTKKELFYFLFFFVSFLTSYDHFSFFSI